jgi:hypothetical protein
LLKAPKKSFDRTLGIALSGGGVRASLFALGALLYLVNKKLNRYVREISSVSGGSITNGFVAHRCDFSKVEPEEFDQYASELALAITKGLVTREFVIVTYGVIGLLVLSIVIFSLPFGLPVYGDIVIVLAFGMALLLRGVLLAKLLNRKLFSVTDQPATLAISILPWHTSFVQLT